MCGKGMVDWSCWNTNVAARSQQQEKYDCSQLHMTSRHSFAEKQDTQTQFYEIYVKEVFNSGRGDLWLTFSSTFLSCSMLCVCHKFWIMVESGSQIICVIKGIEYRPVGRGVHGVHMHPPRSQEGPPDGIVSI